MEVEEAVEVAEEAVEEVVEVVEEAGEEVEVAEEVAVGVDNQQPQPPHIPPM